jgi:hypothetical protein
MVISSQIDVEIDTKNVHRYIGYIADSQPQPRISALIEEYAAEAYHLIVPSYSFVIRDAAFSSRVRAILFLILLCFKAKPLPSC